MNVSELRRRAEDAAEDALEQYGATTLRHMPVDATKLAEHFGAAVYVDDLSSQDLDGFVIIENGFAEITINENDAPARRRFTCAHELGHVWAHRESQGDVGFVDDSVTVDESADGTRAYFRDEHARNGRSEDEVYANAFAAAVLMPKKMVTELVETGMTNRQMAQFFNVSEQAMGFRVANLGLSRR